MYICTCWKLIGYWLHHCYITCHLCVYYVDWYLCTRFTIVSSENILHYISTALVELDCSLFTPHCLEYNGVESGIFVHHVRLIS